MLSQGRLCISLGSRQTRGAQRAFHISVRNNMPSKQSTTSKDTRLAGRLRFYKEVGVVNVSPPWVSADEKAQEKATVESPISAGVDGSDSATGVNHLPKDGESNIKSMQYILSPRTPGTTAIDPTSTSNDNNWYGVTLDGRVLKSPMGQTLALPSQHLAYAVAAEWDAQKKYLNPSQMPLMTLSCTALDQVSTNPQTYQQYSLNYLPTDTTCFWADPTEDRVLHRRQEQAWKSLHNFVEEQFDHPPAFALGANEGMVMTRKRPPHKPYSGLPHHPTLYERAEEWTLTLDAWHLAALHAVCAQSKSFLVAFAVLERDSPFQSDLAKAVKASRVEEEFQIANWGLVEGGHDYDRLNCSVQLHAAQVLTGAIALDNNL